MWVWRRSVFDDLASRLNFKRVCFAGIAKFVHLVVVDDVVVVVVLVVVDDIVVVLVLVVVDDFVIVAVVFDDVVIGRFVDIVCDIIFIVVEFDAIDVNNGIANLVKYGFAACILRAKMLSNIFRGC